MLSEMQEYSEKPRKVYASVCVCVCVLVLVWIHSQVCGALAACCGYWAEFTHFLQQLMQPFPLTRCPSTLAESGVVIRG